MIFYDFEVFQDDWLVVCKDSKNNMERTVIVNDPEFLRSYYESNKADVWVGYNSNHYDQYILKGILCGFNPKDINDFIIVKKRAGWQFSKELNNYPLISYDAMHKMQSLKVMESYLGESIEESDVDFTIQRKLTNEEIQETIEYCTADVDNLIQVFEIDIEEFKAHLGLVQITKSPITSLNKTKAQLSALGLQARTLSPKEWNEEWEYEYVQAVKDYNYQHKEVIEFYDKLRELQDPKAKLEIVLYGVPCVFALGGLHGARPNVVERIDTTTEMLVHADIGSMYPSIMIQWGLLSRAVPSIKIYSDIRDLRLKYKHEKNPLQAPLKIILNSCYGVSGAGRKMEDGSYKVQSTMYDPKRMREVCINGQLLILQLMEKLQEFELIQANTDGLIYKLKKQEFEKFDRIIKEWEKVSRLTMEYDFITEMYQRDVNNYIAVFDNGEIERKGGAVKKSSPLDYDLPIVADAVVKYFLYGIEPRETIEQETRLMPFMKTYKVSSKYKYAAHNGKPVKNKVNRVFASKRKTDTPLYKVKQDKPELFASCPPCYIDNGNIKNKRIPPYLNKEYYIEQAEKRIMSFLGL